MTSKDRSDLEFAARDRELRYGLHHFFRLVSANRRLLSRVWSSRHRGDFPVRVCEQDPLQAAASSRLAYLPRSTHKAHPAVLREMAFQGCDRIAWAEVPWTVLWHIVHHLTIYLKMVHSPSGAVPSHRTFDRGLRVRKTTGGAWRSLGCPSDRPFGIESRSTLAAESPSGV